MALKLIPILAVLLWSSPWSVTSQSIYGNDHCENASLLEANEPVEERLRFAGLDRVTCSEEHATGAGVWYIYEGKHTIAEIDLFDNHDDDVFFSVFTGDCDSLVCVAADDLRFFAEDGTYYYILAAKPAFTYDERLAAFQIIEKDRPVYDVCEGAFLMECDSVYEIYPTLLTPDYHENACVQDVSMGWVKMTGDGTTKTVTMTAGFFNEIYFQVFEGHCDSLRCVYEGDSTVFEIATVPGRDYYIGVTHENLSLSIPVRIRMTCRQDTLNTTCQRAKTIACNDEIFENGLNDNLPVDLVSDEIGHFQGLWYVLEGDSVQHRIELYANGIENLVIAIFKVKDGDCINNMTPVFYNPYPFDNTYVVNTLPGEKVYVKVAFFNQPVPFRLNVQCRELENNQTCQLAKPITCGEDIFLYETAPGDFGQNKSDAAGNWFSLDGSDLPYTFVPTSISGPVSFSIYKNGCDSLEVVKSFDHFFTEGVPLTLLMPAGETYYLRAHFQHFPFIAHTMTVFCGDIDENVFCHKAIPVTCGKNYVLESYSYGISCASDPCNTSEGYWYSFDGNDSIAEIFASFPFQQYSLYEGDCDSLQCLYANETFTGFRPYRFFAESGKTYYIKFFDIPALSQRSFSLTCFAPDARWQCVTAEHLPCVDTMFNLDFRHVASNPFPGVCDAENGYWYAVEGNDKLVSISTHSEVNIHLYEGTCDTLHCIYVADGRFNFYAESGKSYHVQFDSRLSEVWNVRIQCSDYTGGSCEEPIQLVCGDTSSLSRDEGITQTDNDLGTPGMTGFWRSLEGTGETAKFSTRSLFASDVTDVYLEDNACLSSRFITRLQGQDSFYFPTDSGLVYTFLFTTAIYSDVELSVTCVNNTGHHNCVHALEIGCGNPFAYSSEARTNDTEAGIFAQAWYSVEGNGQLHHVVLEDPVTANGYRVTVFESINDCDSLIQIGEQSANGGAFYWRSKPGLLYYIRIGLTNEQQSASDWTWTIQCVDDISAQTCDSALSLECGIEYPASSVGHVANAFSACTPDMPGAWFSVSGDDQVYQLEITSFYEYFGQIYVFVGEGDCDSLICLRSATLDRLDPFIAFPTEAGKNYIIKLAGENGETFPLIDFLVTCENQAENDNCQSAEVITCGDSIHGELANLSPDSLTACPDDLPGLYYAISGDGGEVFLHFESDENTDLHLTVYENACDTSGICLHEADVNTFRNAVSWQTAENTTYYFRLSANNPDFTEFTCHVSCDSLPTNLDCARATALNCGDTSRESFISPLGFTGETPCHFTEDALVYWYTLPRTGQVLELDILEGKDQGHYISLVTGICGNLICERVFDINDDKILIETPEDFNYYIAVHGDAFSANDFAFALQCIDDVPNDECFEAQLVQCGDTLSADVLFANYTPYFQDGCQINPWKDVWYEIEGTGDIVELHFATSTNFGGYVNWFLQGECNALTCLENGPWRNNSEQAVYRFLTQAGERYLFSVQHPVGDTTRFTISCTPRADNDLCEGAENWVFGDTTLVNIEGSLADENIPCYQGQRNGVWYTFEGDGGYVSFASGDIDAPVVSYVLLEGRCDSLICLGEGAFTPDILLEIRTEKDRTYYLVLYGNGGKIISYHGDLSDNFECASALTLACGVTAVAYSRFLIPDQGDSGCVNPNENTAWYAVEGDGNIWDLSFVDSGTDGSLEILTGCGDSCLYRHELLSPRPKPFSFLAVEGQRYILKLNISRSEPEHILFMSTACRPGQPNYSMETAIHLECGDFDVNTDNFAINFIPECFKSSDVTYWYSFVGSDSLFRLSDTLPDGFTATIVNADCELLHVFEPDTLPFQTEADKTYFLVVRHALTDTLASFVLGVDFGCKTNNSNDILTGKYRLSVIPNPFMDKVRIICQAKQPKEANLHLYDSRGRLVFTDTWQLEAGHNERMMEEWSALPSGVYTLRVLDRSSVAEIRLVKL